jgi:hypothetical protein
MPQPVIFVIDDDAGVTAAQEDAPEAAVGT